MNSVNFPVVPPENPHTVEDCSKPQRAGPVAVLPRSTLIENLSKADEPPDRWSLFHSPGGWSYQPVMDKWV